MFLFLVYFLMTSLPPSPIHSSGSYQVCYPSMHGCILVPGIMVITPNAVSPTQVMI